MSITDITFEVSLIKVRRRFFEALPAVLSWSTLIILGILALVLPFWMAIFIIAYDLYVLIRAVYMSFHLLYAYRRLRLEAQVNWVERCQKVSGDLVSYQQELRQQLRLVQTKRPRDRVKIKLEHNHLRNINALIEKQSPIPAWQTVNHAIVLPTYDESTTVLRSSLQSLAAVDYPLHKLHIVLGLEERAGAKATDRGKILQREFGDKFGTFLLSIHPDGLKGEMRGKSANATWAIKLLESELAKQGIEVKDVLVSNFDSDTQVSKNYFSQLTYTFITHPDRYHASYQPLPMYHNNIWDAPAFSRVIATGSTFWQMIESTRPERLVTFSSHSMTLQALRDVNYWQKDIVSEDSRIFWQCLLRYDGHYQTIPIYTTVSMDAALASSWWQTLINQYKQKRRWAWGIENFPYIAEGFLKNKRIHWRTKLTYIWRTLEGHYSWATMPIIIAGLGWLPILFGGPEFHTTVLSYQLPFMARTIMTITMAGLIISTALTFLLLPPRPQRVRSTKYISMLLQWALVPVIAMLLSAFPALDAETRLGLGRDLQFNVMQKTRRD